MKMKNRFYINRFALSLALKQRLSATRKWPIGQVTQGAIEQMFFGGLYYTARWAGMSE